MISGGNSRAVFLEFVTGAGVAGKLGEGEVPERLGAHTWALGTIWKERRKRKEKEKLCLYE